MISKNFCTHLVFGCQKMGKKIQDDWEISHLITWTIYKLLKWYTRLWSWLKFHENRILVFKAVHPPRFFPTKKRSQSTESSTSIAAMLEGLVSLERRLWSSSRLLYQASRIYDNASCRSDKWKEDTPIIVWKSLPKRFKSNWR